MDIGKVLSRVFDLFLKNIVVLIVAMLLADLVGGATLGILMAPLMAGMVFICLKLARGETAEIGDVFKRFDKFGPAFVLFLIVAAAVGAVVLVLVLLSAILAFIPILGWLVAFLLWVAFGVSIPLVIAATVFALCSVVDKNMDFSAAIKDAIARVMAKPLEMWLLSLVLTVISSVLAFVTAPISVLGLVLVYLEGADITVQPSVTA